MMIPTLNRKQRALAAALTVAAMLGYNHYTKPYFNPVERRTAGGSVFGVFGGSGSRALATYDMSVTEPIPAFTENYKNVWELPTVLDRPMFWYIPRAGGSTIFRVFGQCLAMTTASGMGTEDDTGSLSIATDGSGRKHINVDTSDLNGIINAKNLGLVASADPKVDIIFSQHFKHAAQLFDNTHRGRVFAMIRHPAKRAIHQFYYSKKTDPAFANLDLEDYAESSHLVENVMVRALNNELTAVITPQHIETAKEVLRRKVLVGIFEWFDLSVVRFEKYFGWWDSYNVITNATTNYCHYEQIENGDHIGIHPHPDHGDNVYTTIAVRNWADMELYFYAKSLFLEQASLILEQ